MFVRDAQQGAPRRGRTGRAVPAGSSPRGAEPFDLRIDEPAVGAAGDAALELFCRNGIDWCIHPHWKDVLLGPAGLRLTEWLAAKRVSVVKSRSHRTVYRVDLPQGSLYVKECRSGAWRDVLRDVLLGNRALREWQRLRSVRQCGIATVAPLAVGMPRRPHRGARAWLITAAEPALPLEHYLEQVLPSLPPDKRTRARQDLARQLARFVASLHQAGIVHRDLHPGNVLIEEFGHSREAQGPPRGDDDLSWPSASDQCPRSRLLLVDLQAVSVRARPAAWHSIEPAGDTTQPPAAPLGWRQSRRNLVTLNLYFSQHASRTDRQRFWRDYLACRPRLVAEAKRAAREVERQTACAARLFWRRRDRRCVRHGRYFYRRSHYGARALAVRDLPEAALDALLRHPDAPFETPDAQVLKRSSGSQVVRLELFDGLNRIGCVYKRWRPRSVGDALFGQLRTSKGMHAWRMGHALLQRAIATPRPLAVIERRTLSRGLCCYVLWEEIAEAQHLHGAVDRLGALSPAARRRALRHLSGRLARLLRRLHEAGFEHRDLKAANVLATGPPEEPEAVYLLDLDAVRRRRNVGRPRRWRDLSRLLVSFYRNPTVTRTEKLRFFEGYLCGGLVGHPSWKVHCQHLDRLAQRKIRRNQRRGRVIA